MMDRPWSADRRLGNALAASLVLHAFFALFFPLYASHSAQAPDAVTTISFQKIAHVSVRVPAPHPVVARASVVVPKSVLHPRPKRPHPAKPHASALRRPVRHSILAPAKAPSVAAAAPAKDVAAQPALGTSASATAPPLAAAQPNVQPQSNAANVRGPAETGGHGPFLASQDPMLEIGARQELQRRFKMNLTLVVVVSEDGKTQAVEFHPPVGPEVEKQIRDILADARWDVAICGGGIACEGKATIKLLAQ
ncbi:MAG: hypothetical protein M3126_03380 [Candidatus Eremiobacteraeota bacterium]|nr:hypothetical protein [Candidatus Eremiobacteraeota bacterium]